MNRIRLHNMGFYGYHGDLPSETSQGQRFFVDVEVVADVSCAGETDKLEDAINYVEIYDIVKAVMTGPPYHLLEKVGAVIADTIESRFAIIGLTVAVRKPSVPIAGLLDYVEVVTTRGDVR